MSFPILLVEDTDSLRGMLRHALEEMEQLDGTAYDIVVMLQPTSPLRRPEHVTAAIEKLVRELDLRVEPHAHEVALAVLHDVAVAVLGDELLDRAGELIEKGVEFYFPVDPEL